jgi:hypothetical protein
LLKAKAVSRQFSPKGGHTLSEDGQDVSPLPWGGLRLNIPAKLLLIISWEKTRGARKLFLKKFAIRDKESVSGKRGGFGHHTGWTHMTTGI